MGDDVRRTHPHWGGGFVSRRPATRPVDRARPLRRRPGRASLGRGGGGGGRLSGQPLEPGEGPFLHTASPRTGGRGAIQPTGRRPVAPPGTVPALATRPRPFELPVRSAGSGLVISP